MDGPDAFKNTMKTLVNVKNVTNPFCHKKACLYEYTYSRYNYLDTHLHKKDVSNY